MGLAGCGLSSSKLSYSGVLVMATKHQQAAKYLDPPGRSGQTGLLRHRERLPGAPAEGSSEAGLRSWALSVPICAFLTWSRPSVPCQDADHQRRLSCGDLNGAVVAHLLTPRSWSAGDTGL